MALTYLPTHVYPKIIWSGNELELHGLIGGPSGQAVGARNVFRPDRSAIRSDRIAQFTQRREVTLGHLEEAITFTLQHIPGWKAKEIDRFLEEWGLPGKQFEFYLDRFQGAALEFEGTLKDQQGTAGTFTGTSSFEAATFGRGLRLDAGEFLDFPTAPASQQPSTLAAEGILVLVVKPSFAGNDSLAHRFLDIDPAGNGRLFLQKNTVNNLELVVEDSALALRSVSIAVSWSANSEQKIVAKWKGSADLELWLNGVKSGAPVGSGTGVLPGLPTNLRMGAIAAASDEANGLYDRLVFFTRAFDLSASIVQVLTDDFFPVAPNYFNKGELADVRSVPSRPFPNRELWEYTFTIRKGAA